MKYHKQLWNYHDGNKSYVWRLISDNILFLIRLTYQLWFHIRNVHCIWVQVKTAGTCHYPGCCLTRVTYHRPSSQTDSHHKYWLLTGCHNECWFQRIVLARGSMTTHPVADLFFGKWRRAKNCPPGNSSQYWLFIYCSILEYELQILMIITDRGEQ